MDLESVIKDYTKQFKIPQYDLPIFWENRDKHGLPIGNASLPLSARIGNFLTVTYNADGFPWGYIYGLFEIDDPDKKYVTGPESLVQMIMMNMAAIIPACLIFLSGLFFPAIIILTWCFRATGSCGGKVRMMDLLSQRKRHKLLHCTMVILSALCIFVGAAEFYANFEPMVMTIPESLARVLTYILSDFNKYFYTCVEEIKYFLEFGLERLLDAAVYNLTGQFWDLVNGILSRLQFGGWESLLSTLNSASKDVDGLKSLLLNASDVVTPMKLAISAVGVNLQLLKSHVSSMNDKCDRYPAYVRSQLCPAIPPVSAIPDVPSNLKIPIDVNDIISKIDSIDISGMTQGFGNFNITLILNLSNRSIPVDTIKDLIRSKTSGVTETINFDELNPLKDNAVIDNIVNNVQSYLHHELFSQAGHVARLLGLIPIIYVLLVILATLYGVYSTHGKRFPCLHRGAGSALSASVLSKVQIIPLFFHPLFAVICGVLIAVMSLAAPFISSLYTQDITSRVIDRVPPSVFDRTVVLPMGPGQKVSTVMMMSTILKTCRRNDGALKAIGLNVGHFRNLTSVLDSVPWPNKDEFKSKLEQGINHLEKSVIPKHGDINTLKARINGVSMPSANFDEMRSLLATVSTFELDGKNVTFQTMSTDFKDKAKELRKITAIPQAADIANDLDVAADIFSDIDMEINRIYAQVDPLETLMGPLNASVYTVRTTLLSLIDDIMTLADEVKALANQFLGSFDTDYQNMLNTIKLDLRKVIFEIVNFLLDNMFRCGILYDIYRVITELLHQYIMSYLNGLWVASAGVCCWWFTSVFCWKASVFFLPVSDLHHTKKKMLKNKDADEFDRLSLIIEDTKKDENQPAPKKASTKTRQGQSSSMQSPRKQSASTRPRQLQSQPASTAKNSSSPSSSQA